MELVKLGIIGGMAPVTVESISNLTATTDASTGSNRRGMIFKMDGSAVVPCLPRKPQELVIDASATYVIAGGLGALGLELADMMVEHGATHLVFLSRSGPRTSEHLSALDDLRRRECNTEVVKCDVNSATHVEEFAKATRDKGFKIKGVIQCAMVLRVSHWRLDSGTCEPISRTTSSRI